MKKNYTEIFEKLRKERHYNVTFTDGRTANFTQRTANMMLFDADVLTIVNNETGEILKNNGEII